jgi:hypothetical protein
LSDDATSLYYRVLVQNISGVSAAHIHRGAAGVNGPVIFTLFNGSGTFDPTHPVSGTVTLSNNDVFDLLGNNFYVNVHTTANPNGEIRGQVGAYTPPTFFNTQLAGANEVPPVTTTASGQGRFTLTDLNILHFFVKVANISNITAAHIHKGAVGQNGPVIHFLYNGSGVFDPANPVGDGVRLNAENLVDLLTDYYYVNVHTSVNAGGEIRGQISGPRIYLPLVVKN